MSPAHGGRGIAIRTTQAHNQAHILIEQPAHFFWAKLGLLFARISFVQAVLVVLMVLAATAMARGYGVPAR
jgi:hypothetical protein